MNSNISMLNVSRTYAGYLEGNHAEVNLRIVASLEDEKHQVSSYKPIHILHEDYDQPLPRYMVRLLIEREPFEWSRDESWLEVVFFSELSGGVDAEVDRVIRGLDWERMAMDYDL